MKCPNCGKELEANDKFCTECGTKIEIKVEVAKPEEKRIVQSMENSTFLCMISMICYFGWPIIAGLLGIITAAVPFFGFLEGVAGILPLAGFVLAIVAWVKYPKATFPKVLTIVYIVLFILAILVIIILAVSCVNLIQDCDSFGAILNLWL